MGSLTRRKFLVRGGGAFAAAAVLRQVQAEDALAQDMLIIDTHQHLWNTTSMKPGWLDGAPPLLRSQYMQQQYMEAVKGLRVKSVYMEVDMAPRFHDLEAETAVDYCRTGQFPTVAAVIGGRPASSDFGGYIKKHLEGGFVKGVRQVIHVPTTPEGFGLGENFVRGVRTLGKNGLSFDLCIRPKELLDGAKLAGLCPDTRIIVDHCGNADVKAFDQALAKDAPADHTVDEWKKGMDALAKKPRVVCKISGIIARLPKGAPVTALAPVVDACLDIFGPDRVVFGGDWPVCLQGGALRSWVDGLREIIAGRPVDLQNKLWHGNAQRIYALKAA